MAYSLRSRRDPSSHFVETQTDTPVTNPTDSQITANLPQAVPTQLELKWDLAQPTILTNPILPTPELLPTASSKPEVAFTTADSNIKGPARVDPALQTLATLSAEFGPQNIPINLPEVAPVQASTSFPGGDDTIPPFLSANELGPSPTVSGREPISIRSTYNQTHPESQPLHTSLQLSSTISLDDSWKTSKTIGTTLVSETVGIFFHWLKNGGGNRIWKSSVLKL